MATVHIAGISLGNSWNGGAALPNEVKVGDVSVRFGPVSGGRREVCINGNTTMSLGAGSTSSMSMNGLSLRAQGDQLWVNGVEVHFDGPQPVADTAAAMREQAAFKARYPGVEFVGDGSPDRIDSTVKIAPGARVDLSSATELRGNTVIGATATIMGGSIRDARVDGLVSGGNIIGGFVAARAVVSGGMMTNSTVHAGAKVSGGMLNGATIGEGSNVSGGMLNGTQVPPGRTISGGMH